jgi:hypothetical protein
MINVIINEYTYQVPTTWQEVTLEQWIALAKVSTDINHIDILSIFTGLDRDVLGNLPCDAVKVDLLPEMTFLSERLDLLELPRPKVLHLGGKELEPITDPGRERFGQKIYMQQLVNAAIEKGADHWDLVAPTIACYYAPTFHPEGKWDDRHVAKIQALVYTMPVVEAYPEAAFFLSGLIRYAPRKASS